MQLYDGLLHVAPSAGATLGRIAAVAALHGPQAAWELLTEVESRFDEYQPYWALRGVLARQLARPDLASQAYRRAVDLAGDPAVRQFLQGEAGFSA